ncbi:4-(cytidine 5'-diphospho)-2-C-methyl-D-erythritol kinase [Ralstonia solanacearum]|uniref:4-diphosphocytidyl-2-C-methyl-D-erythritol kinase n=1 Tax=Ralstonia solanacearum (strain Po82) TaxID=1031711 RepID=F6G4A5_RALS8|nr:4-(cytidine 5'-diphospho)-2-C-methyl-D-erythritol kinase [Ralstonia solanacearum]AEG70301.1 4-diphosphocytidyl-2-c-methyl-d-erythritol kinase [Ralstonia solanacearum Po82]AMP68420.1 4-diphosphocytidyl-2C-methyl-D-erythritol kinase [Ralstonia solanacearum]AMP74671.1 4-diphosphocytidyl-2C-methyl-D-erythritol kinase [Ralstonia solanacearum]AYB61702.1 4-(cytidine 5'-diphospho)-2-C-methyl-D-erythritol kinase [Ralstonia solanacearum]EUJ13685.1 4-diphosphocytidyl-2C-methyl-D-erythritol kinase [Ral
MSSAPTELRDCPAPAKLNLFLHVVGRRPDGYHLLQTVFQLIDWCDTLHFGRRADARLVRTIDIPGVPAEEDLVIRAARLLQAETGCAYGADIALEKRLPMGGGIGGGSSDAATTLLALNRLWGLDLPRAKLMSLGLRLGADVPFFLFGQNAFAEGIGEELTPIALPPATFVVIHPRVHVPTPEIFCDEGLTRDTPLTIITDFPDQQIVFAYGRNDLQAVAERKYGEIARALAWLRQFSPLARMTGSGACVFAPFDGAEQAQAVADQVPPEWEGRCAAGLTHHPLAMFAV